MERFCKLLGLMALCVFLMTASCALAEDFEGHFLLSDKDVGVCKRMTGEVELSIVIVDVEEAPWDQESRQRLMQTVDTVMAWLEREAAAYGAQLNISARYYSAEADDTIHMGVDVAGWTEALMSSDPALPSYWIDGEEGERGPVLICVNTDGRAFACSNPDDDMMEYCVVYGADGGFSVCHELMHLYGAWDFYTHDDVMRAAETYYPDSIMLKADQEYHADSLTAYVIGWLDEADAEALAFLADTAHLSEESVLASTVDHVQNGFQTETTDVGVYTGMFQDGMYHGWGALRWNDGNDFVGQWSWGNYINGTMTWADGTVYTGSFVDGRYDGAGKLQYPDGRVYIGGFKKGFFHGPGTMHFADGSVYTGGFEQGQCHGWATMVYPDGSVYSGQYSNGTQTGTGTLKKADGTICTGSFVNGTLHGMGTIIMADGTIWSGEYVDGVLNGAGTELGNDGVMFAGQFSEDAYNGMGTRAITGGTVYVGDYQEYLADGEGAFFFNNGDVYLGECENGQFNGQGIYLWEDGSLYSGEYLDGKWHGYGTYNGADGTVLQGTWENGQFIGE